MKTFKSNNIGKGRSIIYTLFSVFILVVFLIGIINDLMYKKYENIKFYLLIIIPFIFITMYLLKSYVGKITLIESKLIINRMFYKKYHKCPK